MTNETKVKKVKKFKKIQRTFSFANEDGYQALAFLQKQGKITVGGMSGYLVNLILEDMQKKEHIEG